MSEVNELALFYEDDLTIDELGKMPDASSDELLVASLNKLGRVDIEAMSKCSGISCEQIVLDLRGAIFQDPDEFINDEHWCIEKGWLLKPQYCSGNIQKKLRLAEEMNSKFPGCFEQNITALKAILPAPLNLDEIHISPGAPWTTPDLYAQFAKELLNLSSAPTVIFNKEIGTWKIVQPDEAKSSVANTMTYGTSHFSALKILEQTMNAKTVKVYDYTPTTGWNYERSLNKNATLAAQEKQNVIINEFDKWVRSNPHCRMRLEEQYNDHFTCYGASPYDGSFLELPDLNPDVTLYPHQRNAIARMLLSKENLLLAHDVGTGKTYEMVVGVHELYRMNISRKNMVVVPNNVLKATVNAHKYLYPSDKILAIFPKDFTPEHRNEVLEKVRDGNYVAVYMAYSSFDMIQMSKDYWINKMKTEIHSLHSAIGNISHSAEKHMLEVQEGALVRKLATYALEAKDTPWLPFEQLGIQTLVVDEAHNYKNIPLLSRTDNIVGMQSANGSKKCKEMLEKGRNVDKLVFSTGTPLTNSLADLFVLQTYLQREELKFRSIDSFDMWISTFGERETNFEIDVDSTNLRVMTRFSKFHNLTELMALFSTVCDFHASGGGEGDDSELPIFNGYTDICVAKSQAQTNYIKSLSVRTDNIRAHKVKRTSDNLLMVCTDGRKCALDIRLVNPLYKIAKDEENKIKACAKQVYAIYLKEANTCQVIFSDIGTPKIGFNVYDALKSELVHLGITEKEIAFVHDATSESKRARLFSAINSGTVRVVIGSTSKLGIGVNIQENLSALHHLSVPWRPADLIQRNGRILRRGNRCKEVSIFRYVTESSFDSYSWQLLENKQRFISSFLSGTAAQRDADDVADAILNFAEIKALAIGNPLIKLRVETANLLERAKISYRQRQRQLIDLRAIADNSPAEIHRLRHKIVIISADIALYKKSKQVIPNDERVAFGEELLAALKDNHMQTIQRLFDIYQGFEVYLPANMNYTNPHVYVQSSNGSNYYLEMDTDKPLGCAMKLDHLLEHLDDRVTSLDKEIKQTRKRRAEALEDIERGNEYQDAVDKLSEKLNDIDRKLA